MTKQDLILDALIEINAIAAGDLPEPATLDFASRALDEIYDDLNATPDGTYSNSFQSFTITPNLQPHTIGPSGATFTVTVRPIAILGANIVLNTVSPAVRSPLEIRDDAWWLNQRVQGITSTVPTDLYYSADWSLGQSQTGNKNGSIFLWPVATQAYLLELLTASTLTPLTLLQTFSLPPGYQSACRLTLAERLASPLTGHGASPDLTTRARDARARVFDNNEEPPRLITADAGMPGGGRPSSGGNYRTGWFT